MNVTHENSEMEKILKSEKVLVLERGRETRPTAPVHCDTAEHIHKSDGIQNAMAEGKVNRRRETRPSAPEGILDAHRGPQKRPRTQRRRESGPLQRRAHRRRTTE